MRNALPSHVTAVFLMAFGSFVGAAQWTGYVFNGETRAPMAGVSVRSNSGLQATTDANGAYVIGGVSVSMERQPSLGWDPAGRNLVLMLERREPLRLEILDPSGRILSRPFDGEAGPGLWRWSASSLGLQRGLVVVRLVHDGHASSWTLLPGLGRGLPFAGPASSARLAAAIDDTLSISRSGFESVQIPVPAGDALVDTAWLASNAVLGAIPWNATIKYGSLKDTRDNKTYRTVQIGSQNWMAQNLNYKPAGPDSGRCYVNKPDSCSKYGRLYSWYEAMAGQFASPALPRPATGICPTGWHLASFAEWNQLASFIGSEPKVRNTLKSVWGWRSTGNGSDAYGFRALPGGLDLEGGFGNSGLTSYWWTSTAGSQDSSVLGIELSSFYQPFTSSQPYLGHSVRCVQGALGTPLDTILSSLVVSDGRGRMLAPAFAPGTLVYRDTVPWTFTTIGVAAKALDPFTTNVYIQGTNTENLAVPLGANGTNTQIRVVVRSDDFDSLVYQIIVHRPAAPPTFGIPWKTGITYGTMVDARDGHVYRTVGIDTKFWMAQNLDYKLAGVDSGYCVGNSIDSCAKYGRLYTWSNAMAGYASSTSPTGVRGICPAGWHLPSDTEWDDLDIIQNFSIEGYKYKATAGWKADLSNGTDFYGFRALPAGWADNSNASLQGSASYWWSSTVSSPSDSLYAVGRWMELGRDPMISSSILKTMALSVRCVKN
ncbi:MAG: cadherin-like beta sandwich domain-containing protein [Fibrobacterota bacterium]|nr:cadherin-like beta sandwich domain-containing protein [Fibrobacterota bacterium]QQS06628.1 MAG: cadherin-like beta sandwich domain-containing protein [Fibrobacterota bacterium]